MSTMYCQECGAEISRTAKTCPKCGHPVKFKGPFSVARLVIGILSIVLSLLILFQSCAAGIVNTLADTGDVGGSAGFMVAVIFIVSGIIGIVTRNSQKKTGPIVCFVLYLLAGLLAVSNSAVYADLQIWGILSIVFGVIFLIAGIKTKGIQK